MIYWVQLDVVLDVSALFFLAQTRLLHQLLKQVINSLRVFCAGFIEMQLSVFFAIALSFLLRHLPLFLHVTLVAHHEEGKLVRRDASLPNELSLPVLDVRETVSIRDVVDQDARVASPVKCAADGLVLFLPGSVPNLNHVIFVVVAILLGEEICSHSNAVVGVELVIDESQDQAALSHAGVADDADFDGFHLLVVNVIEHY